MRFFISIFILCSTVFCVSIAFAQDTPAVEQTQQEFLQQCKSGTSTTNWFYECDCAANQVPAIIKDNQTEKLTNTIKLLEDSCSAGRQVRHPFKRDHQRYDACILLKEIKQMTFDQMTMPHSSLIWMDFTKRNVCKSHDQIRAYHLKTCSRKPTEGLSQEAQDAFCACFADYATDAWMSSKESYGSGGSIRINTEAMLACQKK